MAARVKDGGHDIPEKKIRERWQNSRLNLIRLLPHLQEFVLWDNSAEADFRRRLPKPVLLISMKNGVIRVPENVAETPEWAKPIIAAQLPTATRDVRLYLLRCQLGATEVSRTNSTTDCTD